MEADCSSASMKSARGYHGVYRKLLLCCLLHVVVYRAASQVPPLGSSECRVKYIDQFTAYSFSDSPQGGGTYDLDNIEPTDPKRCQKACLDRCDCGAYAFRNDTRRCILKSSASNYQKTEENITLTIRGHEPDGCPYGDPSDSYEEVQTSMDSPGNDLLEKGVQNLDQKGCKDLCTSLCFCLGYSFYTERGVTQCYIKGKINELVQTPTVDIYVRKTGSVPPAPSANRASLSPPSSAPTPNPGPPPAPTPNPGPPPGPNIRKIVGIVIGAVAAVAGIGGAGYAIRNNNCNCCNFGLLFLL